MHAMRACYIFCGSFSCLSHCCGRQLLNSRAIRTRDPPVDRSTARYFRKMTSGPAGGKYEPVTSDPPCSFCTPDLPSRPAKHRVVCKRWVA